MMVVTTLASIVPKVAISVAAYVLFTDLTDESASRSFE